VCLSGWNHEAGRRCKRGRCRDIGEHGLAFGARRGRRRGVGFGGIGGEQVGGYRSGTTESLAGVRIGRRWGWAPGLGVSTARKEEASGGTTEPPAGTRRGRGAEGALELPTNASGMQPESRL
jgi:hypothetical protein